MSPSLRYRKTPHILIPRCRSLAVKKVICVIECNPISARQMIELVLYILITIRFVICRKIKLRSTGTQQKLHQ